MLKGIPKILSPELVKVMMEMGHGDEIVIADGNFPSESIGQRVVRADGHGAPELLKAIWDEYERIIKGHTDAKVELIERFSFYERAKKAYCVVATGESAIYANVIIKKGVVK